MIEFEELAMKAETDDLCTIFLLKKNVQIDIIKIILRYSLIVVPKTFREWKVVITSVEQKYKFIESKQDYRTEIGIIYGGRDIPMDIRKAKVFQLQCIWIHSKRL